MQFSIRLLFTIFIVVLTIITTNAGMGGGGLKKMFKVSVYHLNKLIF